MSRDFSYGFEVVVRELQHLSEELAQTVAGRIREAGNGLRTVATESVRGDLRGAHTISGIDIDTGASVSVDRRAVLSVPLVGSDGRLIGVHFPREPKEITRMARWAWMRDRTSDREFYLLKPKLEEAGYAPTSTFDDPRPAPWTDPIYIQAHGGTIFNVLVGPDSENPAWRILRVTNARFSRKVGSDDVFLQAVDEARSEHALLLPCATAAGPAARTIADHLHNEVGVSLTVHGFTGNTLDKMRVDESGGTSRFGVYEVRDAAGTPIDPVKSYPPG
ncbi:hypothetical protein AB0B25_25015 [Nocardia sp. NPDC049190]|uniref:hypothetical protein n=1 Tax=Nocardia sp. NPDC049190 TaxID=3155650 RepID=UPI0033FC97C7